MNLDKLNALRLNFIKTFGSEFEILNGSVKLDRYGWDYWLARIKPKKSGLYILNHFYYDVSTTLYSNRSHEFHISVVEKGIRRFHNYNNSGELKQTCPDIWVGDTIIIPILIKEIAKDHKFTKTSKWADGMDWLKDYHHDKERLKHQTDLRTKNNVNLKIFNEALPEIEEVVILKHEGIPRRGFDISYQLLCEVKKPSSFNLKLSGKGFSDIILPIRILSENQPIDALAGHAFFNQFNEETNSSHSLLFHLNIATLRSGDNLIVQFFNERRNSKQDFIDLENEMTEIKLEKLPYSVENHSNLIYNPYDYWLER